MFNGGLNDHLHWKTLEITTGVVFMMAAQSGVQCGTYDMLHESNMCWRLPLLTDYLWWQTTFFVPQKAVVLEGAGPNMSDSIWKFCASMSQTSQCHRLSDKAIPKVSDQVTGCAYPQGLQCYWDDDGHICKISPCKSLLGEAVRYCKLRDLCVFRWRFFWIYDLQ